jgi:hypothetical protein
LPIDIKLGDNWHFTPMVRQDWTDILNSGGASVMGSAQAGNIQGATFSYSDNPSTHAETWSAVGAAIADFEYRATSLGSGFQVVDAGLAPIVAVDRVSNGSKGTNSVDNVYFGLGQGLAAVQNGGAYFIGLEERAAFVYDTDTAFSASLPGGILELEPQYSHKTDSPNFPNPAFGWPMGIGSLASGNSALVLQVRAWFHLEGGDIQQSGTNWNVVKGSFLRMGPEVRGQMTFPGAYNLAISGEYDFIPTVSGHSGENSLYKLGLSVPLTFLSNVSSKSPPISLAVNYTKGGLVLNKQPVNALTVGISILF